MMRFTFPKAIALAVLLTAAVGCEKPESDRVQGYVEGEYVYVASAHAGTLEALSVRRGEQVSARYPLFTLDAAPEKALRRRSLRLVVRHRDGADDARHRFERGAWRKDRAVDEHVAIVAERTRLPRKFGATRRATSRRRGPHAGHA